MSDHIGTIWSHYTYVLCELNYVNVITTTPIDYYNEIYLYISIYIVYGCLCVSYRCMYVNELYHTICLFQSYLCAYT